ncbi:uncharacterized protein L969DRAFT_91725 [Mixia osmundae IAM 14324]|uniref:FACT complex subunit POB3 n=1 Tax=Mixia osmundae (strain CBS 9802 / IAM 14324 / JCM 22182 / KY 12970) TaxID=764103 RepID=G7E0B9_MIXOS|nr:uncharacterized protein L969DRAFT_91725 [Mixia osmundae IAM 14324]KEI42271.1 hypothetical protein L969DRAFT_91725 [Mixia osmundae IAM 14324]GAA96279.1 hypothetical protein E5Q_02945 [Mixia osmundae IAM 14324]
MSSAPTQFDDIYYQPSSLKGRLRLAGSGIGWKASKDGQDKLVTLQASEIKWTEWLRHARGYALRIGQVKSEQPKMVFQGFAKEDFERLKNTIMQHYSLTLEPRDLSVRGWNWGRADVQSNELAFIVAGKPAFAVPLSTVSNSSVQKNEVTLEFSRTLEDEDDPNKVKMDDPKEASKEAKRRRRALPDEMVEMRLYIPGSAKSAARKAKKDKQAETGENGAEEEEEEEDEEEDEDLEDELAAAQAFHDLIKDKADIGQVVGDGLLTFPEILCTTPRGKFDIDLYGSFLRLRGKTYDYKLPYESIARIFLLPRPDEIHVQLVINVDPPLRQGQTRYPYLIFQFSRDEEMMAEIKLSDEELAAYNGKLQKSYEAPAYEVVSNIIHGLANKKVIRPGGFQSHEGHNGVKCNVKADEGYIYFLERSMLFVSKKPIFMPYADTSLVRFERVGGAMLSSRTFDLRVATRGGPDHVFSSVSKEELQVIDSHLKDKGVRVKNEIAEETSATVAAMLSEDDDDDDDMIASEDGDGVKRAAGSGDSESEDEDFQAGSNSDDDLPEEYDENYTSPDSDAMQEDKPTKKKKKSSDEPPKKKAKKSSSSP